MRKERERERERREREVGRSNKRNQKDGKGCTENDRIN